MYEGIEYDYQETLGNFMYKVYGWMSGALAITAVIAYYISTQPAIYEPLFNNLAYLIGLFILQLGLVLALSIFLHKMTLPVAFAAFVLYAVSVGITLSVVFLNYTEASIYATFLVTAGMFGTMCLYGYYTQTDLTSLGNLMLMALFGLILGMFVNMFLKNEMFDFVLSAIGVVVFTLLTAYDAQKIKQMGRRLIADQQMMSKVAILGALTLYLDFINLFLYLLRFMGKRREN